MRERLESGLAAVWERKIGNKKNNNNNNNNNNNEKKKKKREKTGKKR